MLRSSHCSLWFLFFDANWCCLMLLVSYHFRRTHAVQSIEWVLFRCENSSHGLTSIFTLSCIFSQCVCFFLSHFSFHYFIHTNLFFFFSFCLTWFPLSHILVEMYSTETEKKKSQNPFTSSFSVKMLSFYKIKRIHCKCSSFFFCSLHRFGFLCAPFPLCIPTSDFNGSVPFFFIVLSLSIFLCLSLSLFHSIDLDISSHL